MAKALGATLGQGWMFGRPAAGPAPELVVGELLLPGARPARPDEGGHPGTADGPGLPPWGEAPAGPLSPTGPDADNPDVIIDTATYVAARSRAHGPTTALWHAVGVHRPAAEVDGACELTVCGALARVSTEVAWPPAARDVCPACSTLVR